MKRVRMLLRVSSDQQLEKDGDLSIQRDIVKRYIDKHKDWLMDKEYFEGSKSGYKNSVDNREVLQNVIKDAEHHEFDILVVYKDDRLGRRMWEIGTLLNVLKQNGVDVYTTVDDCISPEVDDMMGQMMLAFRYNVAEKSSRDTGKRVKDTAVELVKTGKYLGGAAPYGYELVLSGEISKHGRALKKLVIDSEKADVVRYIYDLSLYKEMGSARIAKELNKNTSYKELALNGVWKSGTITSILKNPIYAGYVAYKRREKINGKYHRLDQNDWIKAQQPNESLCIISPDMWDRVQEKRNVRASNYKKTDANANATIIRNSKAPLALLDVLYCGYCGRKLVNATKYYYWTIKGTKERKGARIPIYRCNTAWQGEPHDKTYQFKADEIEPIVFNAIAQYISRIETEDETVNVIIKKQLEEKKKIETKIDALYKDKKRVQNNIESLQDKIIDAILGDISEEDIAMALKRQKEKLSKLEQECKIEEEKLNASIINTTQWDELKKNIPTWIDVLNQAESESKRVLVNKLVSRVDVTKEKMVITFKISLDDFIPRKSIDSPVPESGI